MTLTTPIQQLVYAAGYMMIAVLIALTSLFACWLAKEAFNCWCNFTRLGKQTQDAICYDMRRRQEALIGNTKVVYMNEDRYRRFEEWEAEGGEE